LTGIVVDDGPLAELVFVGGKISPSGLSSNGKIFGLGRSKMHYLSMAVD
jgi:hypothetical protein